MKSTAAVAPARASYGRVPNSNRSGTSFVEGSSLSGCSVSSRSGEAASTPQCGPMNLYGEHVQTSASSATMSTEACAVACTPSTQCSAPTSCASREMWHTGGLVPMRFEAAVVATRRVRSVTTAATASAVSSPVAGSKSTQRIVAPADCAACTHGRTFESWSRRVTTISSPGPQFLARVREKS